MRLISYRETDALPEAHQYGKTLQGRCVPCGVAYRWPTRKGLPKRLRDARCPGCQSRLRQTHYLLRSVPWKGLEVVNA